MRPFAAPALLPQLYLPNTMMDPLAHRVKYFGQRGFGAYAAIAIKTASVLLADSIRAAHDALNDPALEAEQVRYAPSTITNHHLLNLYSLQFVQGSHCLVIFV